MKVMRRKQILFYGLACGLIIFLLNALEYRFVSRNNLFEIYAVCIALVFTVLGIWLALKLAKPTVETIFVQKETTMPGNFVMNETALAETGISKRELEVLQLMQQGLSNKEIADRLFVSLNTIKTHGSNVFEKLGVNRRTQAIVKARELRIIG
jgi:NarL family two-component system response regulator LiaR